MDVSSSQDKEIFDIFQEGGFVENDHNFIIHVSKIM